MATTQLPPDFKEFLNMLNASGVRYLLVGGYAVGFHGYVRPTNDIDIWIDLGAENVNKIMNVLGEFGFPANEETRNLLTREDGIARMGMPPIRIEILSSISGVTFAECYPRRMTGAIDGVDVSLISLTDLRTNKVASGRLKDLSDVENLPTEER